MALSETLKLLITADGSQASSAFQKLGGDAEKGLSKAEGGSGKLQAALGMLGPASLAAGAAVVAFAKSSIDKYQEVGSEVLKLQQYTGQNTEETSKFRFAAEEAGISVDQLTTSLKFMSKNMETAPQKFDEFGVKIKDANGKMLSVHDVFLNLADDFSKMPNGAQKTAEAVKLLGKAGADMIPFLNRGRDGISALEKETEKYGLVLSSKNLEDIYKNKMAQRELTAAVQGLQIQLAQKLLPTITSTTQLLTGMTLQAQKIPGAFNSAADSVDKFFKQMKMVDPFTSMTHSSEGFFGTLAEGMPTLGGFVQMMHGKDELNKFQKGTKDSTAAVEQLAQVTGDSKEQVQAWVDQQTAAGKTFSSTSDLLLAYNSDMAANADATDQATTSTKKQTTALEDDQKALKDAQSALDEATNKLKGWFSAIQGNLDLESQYQQSIDDLTTAIQQNGATTDLNTQKGRDNRKAIEGVTQAIIEKALAHAKETGNVQDAINDAELYSISLQKQLVQLGFTKKAAADYVAQLGLTPQSIETAFNQSGLQQGMNDVKTYTQLIANINGKIVDVGVLTTFSNSVVDLQTVLGGSGHQLRAYGGPVHRGETYIVGDRRGMDTAETFTPSQDGFISPGAQRGGGGNTYNVSFPNYVGDKNDLRNAIRQIERELS